MTAKPQKPSLQDLIDRPKDSDPWQMLQDIHATLTDRMAPILGNPMVGPLLDSYKGFVDRGLAGDSFSHAERKSALELTAELAAMFPPSFKKFAAIGKARERLVARCAVPDNQQAKPLRAPQPMAKTAASKPAQSRAVKKTKPLPPPKPSRPLPDFSHPAIKTKFPHG